MADNYEEILKERSIIEEETLQLEKLTKQVYREEEEMSHKTMKAIQELDERIERWTEDMQLQNIFFEQRNLLTTIQRDRVQFQEDFQEYVQTYRKSLYEREEACEERLRNLDKGNGGDVNGKDY